LFKSVYDIDIDIDIDIAMTELLLLQFDSATSLHLLYIQWRLNSVIVWRKSDQDSTVNFGDHLLNYVTLFSALFIPSLPSCHKASHQVAPTQ